VNYSCLITPVNNLALNYLGIYFVNYDNRAHRCVLHNVLRTPRHGTPVCFDL